MESQHHDIVELTEDISGSPLYSEDLAPVPPEKRTWNTWSLAAIWVGMAVCIPTYLLAAEMINQGLNWLTALLIIGLANLIITLPMVLNGHAGVKYGVPFPVLGRAAFGIHGIHIASVVRGLVACGWFGIQTWIGGLAIYAIWNAVMGVEGSAGLDAGKFIGFGIFWIINVYFIWNGHESIKWLEVFSAPILVLMGIVLIGWGAGQAGGFGKVLDASAQLEVPVGRVTGPGPQGEMALTIRTIVDDDGYKADEFQVTVPGSGGPVVLPWQPMSASEPVVFIPDEPRFNLSAIADGSAQVTVQVRKRDGAGWITSSVASAGFIPQDKKDEQNLLWLFILSLTAMVGFWATMSISIADITRYVKTQKEQVRGQFIGLPGTMVLYSFVGIFVTCAAVINFDDILIRDDAPWNPVDLLAKFNSPVVVVIAQVFMLIATLSTNIAANVIAPANAFANLFPKQLGFKEGGLVAAIIGIVLCPWWLMNDIMGILVFISGLLGPVLGILICDYYVIRKKVLDLPGLFKVQGPYTYRNGVNLAAMVALICGMVLAVIGKLVPAVEFLYSFSWFTGFLVSFALYYVLMMNDGRKPKQA